MLPRCFSVSASSPLRVSLPAPHQFCGEHGRWNDVFSYVDAGKFRSRCFVYVGADQLLWMQFDKESERCAADQ